MKFKVGDKVRYVGTRAWDDWKAFVPNYKSLKAVVKSVNSDGKIIVGYEGYSYEWPIKESEGDRIIKLEGGLYVNKRRSNITDTSTSSNKSDGG